MSDGDSNTQLLHSLRAAVRTMTALHRPDVDTALKNIVISAVDTVVPAVGGGISRTAKGTVHSAYGTDEDVQHLDQLQARLRQGPCITAADRPPSDGVVHARDLGGPDRDRWPSFAPQAAALGYRSMLSMQLSAVEGHHSALNLYAREPDAFTSEAVTTATLFSLQAAVLLHGVTDAGHLQRALESRDIIGQAKGVLTERFRLSDADAFQMLVEASQHSNIKLVDVARWLLADARRTTHGPITDAPPDLHVVRSEQPNRRPPRSGT